MLVNRESVRRAVVLLRSSPADQGCDSTAVGESDLPADQGPLSVKDEEGGHTAYAVALPDLPSYLAQNAQACHLSLPFQILLQPIHDGLRQ